MPNGYRYCKQCHGEGHHFLRFKFFWWSFFSFKKCFRCSGMGIVKPSLFYFLPAVKSELIYFPKDKLKSYRPIYETKKIGGQIRIIKT